MRRFTLPFHLWRLVLVIVAWNVLFAIDIQLFGIDSLGPFAALAYGGMAVLCFTAPADRHPGTWIMARPDFARRWRWVFWFVGVLGGLMVIVITEYLLSRRLGWDAFLS